MSKHSTNVGEYKEMYLINKFQKDIMENSLGNMSSEKIKSKENLPTLNSVSQTTQTNIPEDLNENKDLPVESATKVVTPENSVSNIPMETNNNIEEELLKNDESKYNDKVTKRITVTKTDKKKIKFIQSQTYQLKECEQEICRKTCRITFIKILRIKKEKNSQRKAL